MTMKRTIKSIAEVQRVGTTGTLEQQTEVVFSVGGDGPFRIVMPTSEFSAEKVRPLLEKRADEIRKVRELESEE